MSEYPNARTTYYKGIRMRSATEAKWAAFFDQLGWVWTYEPERFGNYRPDFFVLRPDQRTILVEAKCETRIEELAEPIHRICESYRKPALVLWSFPRREQAIHKIGEYVLERRPAQMIQAQALVAWCNRCEWAPFVSYMIAYPSSTAVTCLFCDSTWEPGAGRAQLRPGAIEQLWAQACNAAQWRPPLTLVPGSEVT